MDLNLNSVSTQLQNSEKLQNLKIEQQSKAASSQIEALQKKITYLLD